MGTEQPTPSRHVQEVRDYLTRALEAWRMGDHARARSLVEQAHAASATALDHAGRLERQHREPPMT